MPRRAKRNVLILTADVITTDEFHGERYIVIDAGLSNWRFAVGASAAVKIRAAIDAEFPAAVSPEGREP